MAFLVGWWWVLQSGALSCACFSQISAPLAVSVRHTPNCRASGRQRHNTPTRRPRPTAASPSARRIKVSRVPRALPEILIGRQQLSMVSRRQWTPCSSDLAVVQRGSQDVARECRPSGTSKLDIQRREGLPRQNHGFNTCAGACQPLT